MNLQYELDVLIRDFDMKASDVHFLDLIPLIEMIWADGRNQEAERKILYRFTIDHLATLDEMSGHPCVSVQDANDFLDRFAHRRPHTELLDRLHHIAFHRHLRIPDPDQRRKRGETILDYCLDIAAACVVAYPFPMQARVMQEEKKFLKKLITELTLLSA